MKMLPFILAAMLASAVAEDDGKLTIEIPSSVQAVVAKEKGEAGKITSFKKVNETDGTTYVIGMMIDGKPFELSLDAAGRVMRKGRVSEDDGPKAMKIEAVPVKVRTALQREAGAGVIEEVEMQEQKTNYVTDVRIGKRKYRIIVDAEGVLVSKDYTGDDE